jgi:hypothetical protein
VLGGQVGKGEREREVLGGQVGKGEREREVLCGQVGKGDAPLLMAWTVFQCNGNLAKFAAAVRALT